MSVMSGRMISQTEMADIIGVTLRTYHYWENDDKFTKASVNKAAQAITDYFGGKYPLTAEDFLGGDVVARIKYLVAMAESPNFDAKQFSRNSLEKLLTDKTVCRILGIDEGLANNLMARVETYRGDLDTEDWATVTRMILQGRDFDLWMFEEGDRYKQAIYPKSTRRLNDSELARITKIVDQEIEKLAREKRVEEKKKNK